MTMEHRFHPINVAPIVQLRNLVVLRARDVGVVMKKPQVTTVGRLSLRKKVVTNHFFRFLIRKQ